MKIVNWNVGRPSKTKAIEIVKKLNQIDADILVLTETNEKLISFDNYSSISTKYIENDFDGKNTILYKEGEIRTTIWTKYRITNSYQTSDEYTSVCADVETSFGTLMVYGTIIGVFNGLNKRYHSDLENQMNDFEQLFKNKNVCLIGDYNTSFSGHPYPSKIARKKIKTFLDMFCLTNLTGQINDNVCHIAISSNYLEKKIPTSEIWNKDKKLSDHIGICISIT